MSTPPGVAGARLRQRPTPSAARPTVGVVIPCYNYAGYVGAAIESVLSQTGVDVDIVVVDDRSADASAAVVRAIAASEPRVRLIEHEHNRGAVATFNDGLAVVEGQYLVRLDADDLLTPGSLERSVAVAEAHPTVGLVYGHPLHFSGGTLAAARERVRRWTVWNGRAWLRERCRTGLNVITSPEVLMRRSVVDRVGGQRDLAHTHDMEMWLRIAAISDVAYIEGPDQAWHREHASSLSQSIDPSLGDILDRRDAFHTLFDWSGPHLPETAVLRALADRAIADEARVRIRHMYDRGRVDVDVEARLFDLIAELSDDGELGSIHASLHRVRSRGVTARPRPWQVGRAAMRRVANTVRVRRWHRHGVFHRDAATG
jgi:glycosyltransferase involved in cell wall biosynthesis